MGARCLQHGTAHGSEPAKSFGDIQKCNRSGIFAACGNLFKSIEVVDDFLDRGGVFRLTSRGNGGNAQCVPAEEPARLTIGIGDLASIYFGVCVSSKRLHDMGRSGWLAAIPYGVTAAAVVLSATAFLGGIVSTAGYGNDYGVLASMGGIMGLWVLAFLINLAFLIWLGVTAGQPGENIYGPPPRSLANF